MAAVLFIDIDEFKTVNDTMGHPAGDALLKEISDRLRSATRQLDCIARVGGDEFIAVLGDIADIEHVREGRAPSRPHHGRTGSACRAATSPCTCSIGVALFPQDGDDAETLIRNADTAMYQAKRDGRSGTCFFTSAMQHEAEQRVRLEARLRKAIENDAFELVYQPIYGLDGRLSASEALIRWPQADGSTIQPDVFIPYAEASGLIVPIGSWVLRTACLQNAAWSRLASPLRVGVNVSAKQLADPHFVRTVQQALRDSALDPRLLELELTETVMSTNAARTAAVVEELRGCGVRIAIDDFGTGYNSLATLRSTTVDTLKLDMVFVAGIANNPVDQAIASAVITAAHGLGAKVVAEGVETEAQRAMLAGLKCDAAQGFLFARPHAGPGIRCPAVRQHTVAGPSREAAARGDMSVDATCALLEMSQAALHGTVWNDLVPAALQHLRDVTQCEVAAYYEPSRTGSALTLGERHGGEHGAAALPADDPFLAQVAADAGTEPSTRSAALETQTRHDVALAVRVAAADMAFSPSVRTGRNFTAADRLFLRELGGILAIARRAEHRRRMAEIVFARSRAVFDHNPSAKMLVDLATHRFVDVNLSAIAMYGYTREQFLAMTPYDLHASEDVERMREQIEATRHGTRDDHRYLWHRRAARIAARRPRDLHLDAARRRSGLCHERPRHDRAQRRPRLGRSRVRPSSRTMSPTTVLTSLPNRALLYERLAATIARAGEMNRALGVLFIDIDRFKQVNDSLGHGAGDVLLQVIAKRMRAATRRQDCVARMGGDEFVAVFGDLSEPEQLEKRARSQALDRRAGSARRFAPQRHLQHRGRAVSAGRDGRRDTDSQRRHGDVPRQA